MIAAATPQPALEVISFQLAGNAYALAIGSIQEIRSWSQTTPVPMSAPHLIGVVNLRGVVTPVVDLAALLGFPPAIPGERHALIIAMLGDTTVGLLVEDVSDILAIDQGLLQPPPALAGAGSLAFVAGIASIGDTMISLLKLDSLASLEMPQAA
ncbi:MAG: chemotaxis protein CheW [Caulobacter sp.]|jgi:purine-binding chemotaxis protein CheW